MSSTSPDRARVLVLIKGLGIGGAERLIAEGAQHWNREVFDYRVAYLVPWKDQLVRSLEDSGVLVDCVGTGGWWDPPSLHRLRSLISRWRPALIHAHLPTAGIAARLVSPMPVVYTEHNLSNSYRSLTRAANRLTYGRNTSVIAVSEAVAESLHGYPGPIPRVIANGVSPQVSATDIERVRAELGLSAGDRLVVHVGNIRPHKGHNTLISAARKVMELDPSVVIVSIGGEKHPGDLQRVRNMAADIGVADRLRFLGRRDDARPFLAAADLVVDPADFEGLPLVVLEALALERPVVATSVGGVPTVVIDGVTGRLVPPGAPTEMAEMIVEMLHSSEAATMAKAGARLVIADHGIDRMVADYEAVYLETLSG